MDFTITHNLDTQRFEAHIDGHVPYVEYSLDDNTFDIIHTIVPQPLEGQGIASKLVSYAYQYAKDKGYNLKGSCSYAHIWLQRHPM